MASIDISSISGIVKTKYPSKRMLWLAYKNNPFLALVPKDKNFGGANKQIPVRYGQSAGASTDFSVAQANKSAQGPAKFLITRVQDYALSSISGDAIDASMGSENALMSAVDYAVEDARYNATRSLAINIWRNGGGARGQISSGSTVSTATITLTNPADIVNFYVGMKVQTSTTDGTSGALRNSGGTLTITAINRDTGAITTSANWDTNTGTVATDYIFRQGDFGVTMSGVGAWCPLTAPGATAFFGVNRSVDTEALGGIRVTATGANVEEVIVNAMARAGRNEAVTSHIFMNPLDRAKLVKCLGTKINYDRVASNIAGIEFKAIEIEGQNGVAKVIADTSVPQSLIYGLQLDTWELCTLGEAPKFINMRGQDDLVVEYNADALEVRMGYRGQLACYAPGMNWVTQLT